jgi:hypothetical protein
MRFEMSKSVETGNISFSGEVDVRDLAELRLDRIDRAVISSEITNAAEALQSLEIIFRRYGEQHTQ